MTIRNQALIKRPWLFPVCSIIGCSVVFFQSNNLSTTATAAIYVGVIALMNTLFFVALKQTLRKPKTTEFMSQNQMLLTECRSRITAQHR